MGVSLECKAAVPGSLRTHHLLRVNDQLKLKSRIDRKDKGGLEKKYLLQPCIHSALLITNIFAAVFPDLPLEIVYFLFVFPPFASPLITILRPSGAAAAAIIVRPACNRLPAFQNAALSRRRGLARGTAAASRLGRSAGLELPLQWDWRKGELQRRWANGGTVRR